MACGYPGRVPVLTRTPATLGALLRVVAAAFCWGLAAVFAKHAFEHGVPPARMAQARVTVALLVLAPLLAWRRPALLRPPRSSLPLLVGFGGCIAAVNFAYYVAIDHLAVGVAIALQYTGPVMLLGFSALVARRAPGRLAWVAGTLTLAGAVLVSRAMDGLAALDGPGLAAGLASAVLFAAYLLTAEQAGRRGASPATVLLWGFVAAVAVWSVAEPWWSFPFDRLTDPQTALAVLGVGIVGTLVPFFLAVGAVRVIPAATAGIAASSEPVFAAALAWLLLGQQLTAVQLAGGALVVAGVMLAQVAGQPSPDRHAVEPAPHA
ncbi:MAG TPA: EamA family transporter [Actinomycetes bacterium]|nr:EamA family transporter [Actinomycetes bacterium]